MTAQTLLTLYCIGATFLVIPLAFALRTAWRRLDSATDVLAYRDARISYLERDRVSLCEELQELKTAKHSEPPPGCVGATATSRGQRRLLNNLHLSGRPTPVAQDDQLRPARER